MGSVARVDFRGYTESVTEALEEIGAAERLPREGLVILKPNLTNDSPPPVTTPVSCVEAVWEYISARTEAEIAVGEGCGSGRTRDAFRANGYLDLAERRGLRLIDFNEEPDVKLNREDALQLEELWLPKIALDAFIVSIPILKDHSFTTTTIAMKNMFGLCPAPRYRGNWNKSKLHSPNTDKSVVDVCGYKKPDLCVVDAVIALEGMHLEGTPRKLKTILAGFDPVAVDAEGSRMMGHDPAEIEYLTLADGLLGNI
jgi:uncharacterized protein (DUF362 family)